jgi:flagellar motor protein MotB
MITLLLTFFILYFSVDDQKGSAPKVDATLLSALTRMDIKAEERKTSFGLDGALKDKPLRVGNLDDTGIIEFEAPPVGGKVHKMGSQLILEFPDLSFFDFGKVEVNSVGERSLKQFAKLYSPFAGQNRLGIRAFTDDRPVKPEPGKRFQDNLELSALRSVATMRVLEKAGIPLGLMRLGGWGELSQTRKSLEQAKQQKEQQLDQARKPASLGKGDPFSRKVILVIEPEVVP